MSSIKDTRKDLEDMIKGSKDSLNENIVPIEGAPELKMIPTFDVNLKLAKKNCIRRARRMITNTTGLMLSNNMVKENPYLRNKMQVDIISLSGLFYQLEISELMQGTLMEEVRSGAAQPRMFEVFGNLSKTIGDLNKQLLQTVEAIKTTYKDVKFDIKEKGEELKAIGPGGSSIVRNEKGVITLGTKELIKETKKLKIIQEGKIEDVEEIKT